MLKPNMPTWKIVIIFILIALAIFVNYWFMTHAKAEEQECWILCQPDSWVNVRMNPSKKSTELGRLEVGDKVYTDGKTKNGFLHIYGLWFEMDEGWVKSGYVVYDEPFIPVFQECQMKSNGRVMARKTINGKRRCWIKKNETIKVY